MNPFRTVLIILAGLASSSSILDGDPSFWNRNGFIVKILSRNKEVGKTKSCTGSLISASFVLTAKSCVTDTNGHDDLDHFVVQVPRLDGKDWFEARLLRRTDNWAMLRIKKQNISKLCDESESKGKDRPHWVAKLNLSPSLKNASLLQIESSDLEKARCYMLGFKTTDQPEDFITQEEIIKLDLEKLHPSKDSKKTGLKDHYRSNVKGNFTACFDDAGSPVLCRLYGSSTDIQVGVFQWLKMPEGAKIELESKEQCASASEMEFAITAKDKEFVDTLEEFGMSELVSVYKRCEFV